MADALFVFALLLGFSIFIAALGFCFWMIGKTG